ncbi:MAG: hydrogenase maturation nickel metallochaperone HypA [Clostridia bacterium]|nr:hydrogenase maturation nickel metallochaperone HypA [Clostridia bacterium]
MHEMAITQSILRIALDAAERNGAERVLAIHLKLGDFSDVVPAYVQAYFDIVSEGSIACGARITETRTPARVRCRTCGRESAIEKKSIQCPHCKSADLELLSGTEFTVESVEIE